MKGRVRILSVGALTLDTILRVDRLPATQGKLMASDGIQIASGMASSAACAAQRLGAEAWLWASAGDDTTGDLLVSGIKAEGVDCSFVRRVTGGCSALSAILVDAQGERIIVPYYDPATQADPHDLPFAIADRFDAVMVDVRWPGAAALALEAARKAGIPAILDADIAPLNVLERLLPLATHIVASEPAALLLCPDATDTAEACRLLFLRTGVFVAVTGGSAGTWWLESEGQDVRHVAAPRIKAVDTLAAGDVFHGAFAVALAEQKAFEAAFRFASAAAAIKCTRFGGRLGAPTRGEVEEAVARWWPA
jgi:sulfofructose kinase